MKQIFAFPFLAVLLFVLLGCGSDGGDDLNPSTDKFFKFKLDGVQVEYPMTDLLPMTFTYDDNGKVFSAVFQALGNGSNGTADFVNVFLRSETKFQTGVDYELQDGVSYNGISIASINFTYADKEGQVFNAVLLQSSLPSLVIKDTATIRFTKISDSEVEGIFSAKVYGPVLTSGRGDTEKVISDGQFKMKLLDNSN